jgi:hypothetical protein
MHALQHKELRIPRCEHENMADMMSVSMALWQLRAAVRQQTAVEGSHCLMGICVVRVVGVSPRNKRDFPVQAVSSLVKRNDEAENQILS